MTNNKGSVSVEAAISFPIFLFTMLFFVYVCQIYRAKATIYEGCIETADYMAQYSYLSEQIAGEKNLITEAAAAGMLLIRFREYVDDKALLEKYVVGGESGVCFVGSSLPDDHGYIDLQITYLVHVNIPLLGSHSHLCREHIRQRAYLGYREPEEDINEDEDNRYVFVAKNGVVYHTSRSCTYLMPDIHSSSKTSAESSGYTPCEYCGASAEGTVYITTDGDRYHSVRNCSRLKRTVFRKKKSEVELPPCSKCGN